MENALSTISSTLKTTTCSKTKCMFEECVHKHMCIRIHVYMNIWTCRCVQMHIHIHIHMYIDTYIHIYIYIYIWDSSRNTEQRCKAGVTAWEEQHVSETERNRRLSPTHYQYKGDANSTCAHSGSQIEVIKLPRTTFDEAPEVNMSRAHVQT